MDRLDTQSKDRGNASTNTDEARPEQPRAPAEPNPAPVIMIREAATDAGVSSPEQFDLLSSSLSDVISAGLVTSATAHSLLKLLVFDSPAVSHLLMELGFASTMVVGSDFLNMSRPRNF